MGNDFSKYDDNLNFSKHKINKHKIIKSNDDLKYNKSDDDLKYNKSECIICMDNKKNIIIPCNHYVMCQQCANQIINCPICRKLYETNDIKKVFE